MMFIYVYYGLFAYTNLVDIMSLFFTVFLFNAAKFDRFLPKFVRESSEQFSKKFSDLSVKSADNSTKLAKIQDSRILLSSVVSTTFPLNFSKFCKNQQNR
jgi:hypothetical protein